MEYPVRVAFCKVLFWKNGGRFTKAGLPIVTDGARGKCDRAYDCVGCPYLAEWLSHLVAEGWQVGWECDACLRETWREDVDTFKERSVQGFYQSGRSEFQEGDPEFDPDRPIPTSCTRCGFTETSFLQLVLRR